MRQNVACSNVSIYHEAKCHITERSYDTGHSSMSHASEVRNTCPDTQLAKVVDKPFGEFVLKHCFGAQTYNLLSPGHRTVKAEMMD